MIGDTTPFARRKAALSLFGRGGHAKARSGDAFQPAEKRCGRARKIYFPSLLVMVLAASLFQNLFRISDDPLRYDEQLYADVGWRYMHWGALNQADTTSVGNNFEHPPLAKTVFGLAEVIAGHPSVTAARVGAALCALLAAVILGLWLGRAANRWVGLLAAAALALIPMTVFPDTARFDRTAMLESVAEPLMIASLALGWFWFRSSGRSAWAYAAAAGASAGLATASKENGFLGLVGPVLLGLAWSVKCRTLVRRLLQTCLSVSTALFAFICCYLPFGDPVGRVRYLLEFEMANSRNGHPVGVMGRVYSHPPWWTNLWFAHQGVGSALSCAIPAGALIAIAFRKDRLVAWCSCALVVPFFFHAFVSGITLSYYWSLWIPAAIALLALGIGALVNAGKTTRKGLVRVLACVAVSGALAAIIYPIVDQFATVAHLQPLGAANVPGIRKHFDLTGAILTTGTYLPEIQPYLAHSSILTNVSSDTLGLIDTILVGQPRCNTPRSGAVLALVEANLANGSLTLVRTDRLMSVYVRVRALSAPTVSHIASTLTRRPADGC